MTALFAAIIGAVIAGHGQSAKLRELKNAEDANVTERFTSALDQLAHQNENVRIGGVYALERIGHDSERDRKTIVSILRANLYRQEKIGVQSLFLAAEKSPATPGRTREIEVALIISIMRLRRPAERDELASYLIQGTSLEGADLSHIYAAGGSYTGVYLADTSLQGSDFRNSSFHNTILYRADFSNAFLQGADFRNAELSEANFRNADLRNANFDGAILEDADFRGSDVRGVTMTHEQFGILKKPLNRRDMKGLIITDSQSAPSLDAADIGTPA